MIDAHGRRIGEEKVLVLDKVGQVYAIRVECEVSTFNKSPISSPPPTVSLLTWQLQP